MDFNIPVLWRTFHHYRHWIGNFLAGACPSANGQRRVNGGMMAKSAVLDLSEIGDVILPTA